MSDSVDIDGLREQAENLRCAIDYALSTEDGLEWLRAWAFGDATAMAQLAAFVASR